VLASHSKCKPATWSAQQPPRSRTADPSTATVDPQIPDTRGCTGKIVRVVPISAVSRCGKVGVRLEFDDKLELGRLLDGRSAGFAPRSAAGFARRSLRHPPDNGVTSQ
jgi:hypothetical protein